MSRYPQVKSLTSVQRLREHLASLGVHMPVAEDVDPAGVLASPAVITDGAAGELRTANRFAVLPMEGWDATPQGRPTELVLRRWGRFGESGCGLVWGEATAVRPDGRANPNQLCASAMSVGDLATLHDLLDPSQVAGLQLTHSGRWSRPGGTPAPRTAYAHPLLDRRVPEPRPFTDAELDDLAGDFVEAARKVREAGFDFVDVKHCHGYLLHELLSAYDRPGAYGGDLQGRTRFLRTVVQGIRAEVPDLAIALRLSLFDFAPYQASENGTGRPETQGPYRHAFGGDGTGSGVDLTETHALLDVVEELGIGLAGATAGSPYYNHHVQRPAYFPPSDGYRPPEDPLIGVARQLAATAEITARHPRLCIVGAGYSYLQDWAAHVAQAVAGEGGVTMVGLGRMSLSYPRFAADVLAGVPADRRLVCRTFSDCTTGPRNGLVSGCYPIDPFYKSHPQRGALAAAKARRRAAAPPDRKPAGT